MTDTHELIRRVSTIRLSRIKSATIFDARIDEWYILGDLPPNYPMPALLQDSQSDLAERWSNWMDDDRLSGHKY